MRASIWSQDQATRETKKRGQLLVYTNSSHLWLIWATQWKHQHQSTNCSARPRRTLTWNTPDQLHARSKEHCRLQPGKHDLHCILADARLTGIGTRQPWLKTDWDWLKTLWLNPICLAAPTMRGCLMRRDTTKLKICGRTPRMTRSPSRHSEYLSGSARPAEHKTSSQEVTCESLAASQL